MEGSRFAFMPPEEPAELFDLGDGKASGAAGDDDFRDDLFESISEAHFLPTLDVHGESLLQSLVEKGCEDNQILDQLSAQLSTEAVAYEQGLLADAPVSDLIERLESLESPSRSAAQGLLHLRHRPARRPSAVDPFVPDEVFATEQAPSADLIYADQIPDLPDTFNYGDYEDISPAEAPRPAEEAALVTIHVEEKLHQQQEGDQNDLGDIKLDILAEEELEEFKKEVLDLDLLKKEDPEETIEKPKDLNEILDIDPEEMDEIEHLKLDASELEIPQKEDPEEEVEKPTDLSVVLEIDPVEPLTSASSAEEPSPVEGLTYPENEASDKHDDLPKDLSIHRRTSSSYASPRRIDIPRVPSRGSDSMQSPQPSGIPAMTPSPTSKCRVFLENLYASTSPKMYTSEVTIQQCIPLNLGKHRKSASPTVSSCSEEVRNVNKDPGEPQEKRGRRESNGLNKICNLLKKSGENKLAEAQQKRISEIEQLPPLKQLELLKSNKNFNLPDQMLVPRNRLNDIISAPGKEIPALLMDRFQLNLPEILQDPNSWGDSELIVVSLEQIRQLIIHSDDSAQSKSQYEKSGKSSETNAYKESEREIPSTRSASRHSENKLTRSERTATPSTGSERTATPSTSSERTITPSAGSERTATPSSSTPQPAETTTPRAIHSAGHLADDIDAANAAAYQMSWMPAYLNHMNHMKQLEAFAACSQNPEFLKALNSAGYAAGYGPPPHMFHPRFGAPLPAVAPVAPLAPVAPPPHDYETRMQLLMWQESVHAHARQKRHEAHKESHDLPGYAHHKHAASSSSSSRYTRPSATPPAMPFYVPRLPPPHEYQTERRAPPEPRPRISVKSLTELQQTAQAARRSSSSSRRRDEPEVGSTTSAGELPQLPQLPPHLPIPPIPHDPTAFPLWHPLFSNQQKGQYTSPWSWTTVTATGD